MDYVAENAASLSAIIIAVCGAIISITSFLKSLKSETRTMAGLKEAKTDVQITREGIVQGFKDAVVTKDLKISINKQVETIMDIKFKEVKAMIAKHEERRTKMMYWSLRILKFTAASDKLTAEQQSEINELLAMIADEEQIIDTFIA